MKVAEVQSGAIYSYVLFQ